MIENYINRLFCKDNLELLKELPDNSIDLIYGDILYGTGRDFVEYVDLKCDRNIIESFYIPRLIEMKRVLKETGSIYLHMDTLINHWIRLIMDDIFGYDNFINEIIWCYKSSISKSKIGLIKSHNNIYHYSKNKNNVCYNDISYLYDANPNTVKRWIKYAEPNGDLKVKFRKDKNPKSFMSKSKKDDDDIIGNIYNSNPIDWWEISIVARGGNPEMKHGKYPTQKPEKLLERIILASSNENDIVLDCFLGSGTSMVVAKKNNRKWIGCDINPKSIELTDLRLNDIEDKSKQIEHQNKLFEF